MAAATYGIGLSFMGLASAAGGMEVNRDQVAMVHQEENILPASLSRGFKKIINGLSGNNDGGTGHLAFAGAGGTGGHQFHFNINGATDPQAVSDQVMTRVKRFFRSGGAMK
jgi:hypothetical protein